MKATYDPLGINRFTSAVAASLRDLTQGDRDQWREIILTHAHKTIENMWADYDRATLPNPAESRRALYTEADPPPHTDVPDNA
jgi:hypothetical protein